MKDKWSEHAIFLDGREIERVIGWDTAVSRAVSILSGGFGTAVEVVDQPTGNVSWCWNKAWDNPTHAVQFVPGVGFTSESSQFDPIQTVPAVWLALFVSLAVNIALLWGIYYLIF